MGLRVTEETLGIGLALEPLAWEISQLEGKCHSSGFGVEGLGLGVQSFPVVILDHSCSKIRCQRTKVI